MDWRSKVVSLTLVMSLILVMTTSAKQESIQKRKPFKPFLLHEVCDRHCWKKAYDLDVTVHYPNSKFTDNLKLISLETKDEDSYTLSLRSPRLSEVSHGWRDEVFLNTFWLLMCNYGCRFGEKEVWWQVNKWNADNPHGSSSLLVLVILIVVK